MKDKKAIEKKRKIMTCFGVSLFVIFLLYWIFIYYMVSMALVPEFMRKMDAFEEITEKGYAEQVQSNDIKENRNDALEATRNWYNETEHNKWNITSTDGYSLVAMNFMQEEYSDKWVLVLHGYTGWKEEMYEFAYWYYQQGYNVLVPDLRCQGESEGDFIGMGYTDHFDCQLWLEQILQQDSNAQIVLHGQSMGAATALILSGDEIPKNVVAIVSDCAYTDATSMFLDKAGEWFHLPSFPIVPSVRLMLLCRGGYDLQKASALEAVRRSSTPTLFIHGKQDALIYSYMSEQLYEAASCEKELLLIEGAGHAQAQSKAPELYYSGIEQFLRDKVVDLN